MRILDLFCGAGGAAVGYHRAGWEVVGVDIRPQPHYPFTFHQADALTFPLDGFDAIHASPPCQGYSQANNIHGREHPMLIDVTRSRLALAGVPWIMENVRGAAYAMSTQVILCGTMFQLHVYRHRLFESSHMLWSPRHPSHPSWLLPGYLAVYGHQARGKQTGNRGNDYERATVQQARAAMGIEWMNRGELSEAIPPAYTHWLGAQLLDVARAAA